VSLGPRGQHLGGVRRGSEQAGWDGQIDDRVDSARNIPDAVLVGYSVCIEVAIATSDDWGDDMRRSRLLAGTIVLGVAVIGSGLFGGVSAWASNTPKGGTIYVSATPKNGATDPIVIVGAIGDYGTATTVNQNGKVDSNGDYVKIVLKHGGFEINTKALKQKANSAAPTVNNTTTCSFSFTASGPVTLFNGSGSYKGISGTVDITENLYAILPRFASGKHKGQCNEGNSSTPIAFVGSISGSGKVSFS
jgi:hypothetical protein